MKTISIESISVPDLVNRFAELAIAQYQAELGSDIAKQNRLIKEGWAIVEELRTRPNDQRSALVRLYDHPNIQVRLNAARLTLAVAPQRAREVIENIAGSKEYPQAMDAGMCLWALEKGVFKPA